MSMYRLDPGKFPAFKKQLFTRGAFSGIAIISFAIFIQYRSEGGMDWKVMSLFLPLMLAALGYGT